MSYLGQSAQIAIQKGVKDPELVALLSADSGFLKSFTEFSMANLSKYRYQSHLVAISDFHVGFIAAGCYLFFN